MLSTPIKRTIATTLSGVAIAGTIGAPAAPARPIDLVNAGEPGNTQIVATAHTASRLAKANVYVPPASAFTDTVAPATASAGSQAAHPDRHVMSASSSAFDEGSAIIGAAATAGLVLIVVSGFAATRRARVRLVR